MSFCTTDILLLSSAIYQTLGSPPTTSIGYISGWITSSGNLGDLTNKLDVPLYLSGDAPCVVGLDTQEAAVLRLAFMAEYYNGQALSTLAGVGVGWLELKEGDTTIRRESRATLAKEYRGLRDSAYKELRVAISDYKRDKSSILSVDYSDLPAWPQS
jgi:hypothetical protein